MTDWLPVAGADELADELVLTDLDLIAELTHPTRSTLLHRLRHPRSAAELADDLQVPVTRLYHHLNRLEDLGLIKVVATRRSGAKTERRYRISSNGFRIDLQAVRGRTPTEVGAALGTVFDVTKTEFRREIDAGTLDPEHLDGSATLGFLGLSLTADQRSALLGRLRSLIDEFSQIDEGNLLDPEASRFRVLLAGFPISD